LSDLKFDCADIYNIPKSQFYNQVGVALSAVLQQIKRKKQQKRFEMIWGMAFWDNPENNLVCCWAYAHG
jgi:hypothetical protein